MWKERIIKWLVAWLVQHLTKELVEKWAEELKAWLVPIIDQKKDEVFAQLRAAAADTETQLDDAAVDALEALVDAFLPCRPQTI